MKIIAVEMVHEECYKGKVVVKDSYGEILVSFHGKYANGETINRSKFLTELNDCEKRIVSKITKGVIK